MKYKCTMKDEKELIQAQPSSDTKDLTQLVLQLLNLEQVRKFN